MCPTTTLSIATALKLGVVAAVTTYANEGMWLSVYTVCYLFISVETKKLFKQKTIKPLFPSKRQHHVVAISVFIYFTSLHSTPLYYYIIPLMRMKYHFKCKQDQHFMLMMGEYSGNVCVCVLVFLVTIFYYCYYGNVNRINCLCLAWRSR